MAAPFGRYQLVRRLASGGMGEVFLARRVEAGGLDTQVVLKRVLPHLASQPGFMDRFLEEARLAARLHHPNIVEVLELGEVGGLPYMAMEYVPGADLRLLQQRAAGPLPPAVALRIAADVAAALEHAHGLADAHGQPLQLVHGDVSPQNVLVGLEGQVKLIDFGVASAVGHAPRSTPDSPQGKYPYMSPEQAQGHALDARSDLFSLGLVLWELLTGARLFHGESDLVSLRRVRACHVPAPSALVPGLPRALDAVTARALAREPGERWQDARALRVALEESAASAGWVADHATLENWMHGLTAERLPSPSGRGAG